MSLTPLGDALSKHLGQSQSPVFIVFLRYFVAGIMALAIARAVRVPVRLPKEHPHLLLFTSALVISAMGLLILALSMVPLSTAVGAFLIAPIIAVLISVVAFGEQLTPTRFLGAVLSFLGAILILRPQGDFQPGVVVALAGGGLLGAFLAVSRAYPLKAHPVCALALQCLIGSAMVAPLALPAFKGSLTALLWPALGLGAVTAATHFLTVAAYQRAEAARLAPFFYFNLVAALVVGALWFREWPDFVSLLGLGAIVAGGLISLLDSRRFEQGLRRFFFAPVNKI